MKQALVVSCQSSVKILVRASALVILCLGVLCGSALAQRKDDVAMKAQGALLAYIPGAQVRVCTQSASGTPCSPLATIYTDSALTTTATNPFYSDEQGNYHFYAQPGAYLVQLTDTRTGQVYTQPDVTVAATVFTSHYLTEPYPRGFGLGHVAGSVHRIFAGIDSLTNGSWNTSYFRDYFVPIVRSQLGDGGPGYQSFDYSTYGYWGSGLVSFNQHGLSYCSSDAAGASPRKYSLEGKCSYATAAVNGDLSWDAKQKWTSVRIYYLTQPGGGSFRLYHSALGASDPAVVAVNTAGTLALSYLDFAADGSNSGLVFDQINGAVAIFGGDFSCSSCSGVTFSNLGLGGQKVSEYSQLDATFQQAWYAALKPDIFLLNGGMNDRTISTSSALQSNLESIVAPILAGSQNTAVVLIQPNDSPDSASNYLPSYYAAYQAVATAHGFGYYSVADSFGSFTHALSLGLMHASNDVHPSPLGTWAMATGIARYLGYVGNGNDPGPTLKASGSGAAIQWQGTLTPKTLGTSVAVGAATMAYDLGLTNGYPAMAFNVTVTAQRSGTGGLTARSVQFSLTNTTVSGRATVISPQTFTSSLLYKQLADANDHDFTVQLTQQNNRVQLIITPTGYAENISVSGTWAASNNTVAGVAVFENTVGTPDLTGAITASVVAPVTSAGGVTYAAANTLNGLPSGCTQYPCVVAQSSASAQANSIGSATLYTPTVNDSTYEFGCAVRVTTQGTAGTAQCTISCGGVNGGSTTVNLNTLGSAASGAGRIIWATGAQACTYSTTVSGNSGGAYDVSWWVERKR